MSWLTRWQAQRAGRGDAGLGITAGPEVPAWVQERSADYRRRSAELLERWARCTQDERRHHDVAIRAATATPADGEVVDAKLAAHSDWQRLRARGEQQELDAKLCASATLLLHRLESLRQYALQGVHAYMRGLQKGSDVRGPAQSLNPTALQEFFPIPRAPWPPPPPGVDKEGDRN